MRKIETAVMRTGIWIIAAAVLSAAACHKGHGLDPEAGIEDRAGIRGRITFTGTWPDSTKEVRIAAVRSYPHGVTDPDSLLAFMLNAFGSGELFFSDTLARFTRSADYELELAPAEYEWILAAWFPDIPLYLAGVKELGAFRSDSAAARTPVRVIPGSFTEGIDITADVNRAYGAEIFYKPVRQR